MPKRLTQAWRLAELDRPVGLVVKAFASGAEDSTGRYVDIALNAVCLFVGWLLNVPATCECISGTDLHRQFDVLPH